MTLHLFTPYHDEALAQGSPYYYPSSAARTLMARWWALPALWAEAGDAVVLPDEAERADSPFLGEGVRVVRWSELRHLPIRQVQPWGWDALTIRRLSEAGVDSRLLPDEAAMQRLRQLSSRRTSVQLLPRIRQAVGAETIGEARMCGSQEEVADCLTQWGNVVAKAPWSCSGRGVFRIAHPAPQTTWARVRKILRQQGSIEIEPYYERAMDLALEYEVDRQGQAVYAGLSLFHTQEGGAYSGNLAGHPAVLEQRIPPAVRPALESVRQALPSLLATHLAPYYRGPLGIDMMVVRQADQPDRLLLHPCVEINLRPTMGYAALWASRRLKDEGPYLFNPDAQTPQELFLKWERD